MQGRLKQRWIVKNSPCTRASKADHASAEVAPSKRQVSFKLASSLASTRSTRKAPQSSSARARLEVGRFTSKQAPRAGCKALHLSMSSTSTSSPLTKCPILFAKVSQLERSLSSGCQSPEVFTWFAVHLQQKVSCQSPQPLMFAATSLVSSSPRLVGTLGVVRGLVVGPPPWQGTSPLAMLLFSPSQVGIRTAAASGPPLGAPGKASAQRA